MITTCDFLKTFLARRIEDERGASLVEYSLLVALIAVVCIAAVSALGDTTGSAFHGVTSSLGN